MTTLCSEFVGSALAVPASRQASVVKRAHLRVVNPRAVAIEPPRTWVTTTKVLPKVQENKLMVAPSEKRSLLMKLEGKLRAAAANAAEKALHKDVVSKGKEVPVLASHRSRMANWWRDHLAIRAETTECVVDCMVTARYGDSDDEDHDDMTPSFVGKSREAESDQSRAALREFYYPRSDPNPYK